MPAPEDDLVGALRTLQRDRGSLSFAGFMETVLYHPTLGYYARSEARAGRDGDFLTSPEVTPLFGACVARWVEAVWGDLGAGPFHFVEVGAGRGSLARAVLDAASPGFRRKLTFHLVERGAAPRRALEAGLSEAIAAGLARTYASVDELPARLGDGAFVANELFDNLPVHRVLKADGWREIRVRVQGSRLREVLEPAPPPLLHAMEAQRLRLGEGQSCEVCLDAQPLLEAVLRRLDRGGLLLFDYGGEAAEVAGDAAPHGTVAAHRGHARHGDLYAALGDQDITAHVNFTPLREAAERLGFRPAVLDQQARFLLDQGLAEAVVQLVQTAKDDLERLRVTQVAKQVYHPEAMGEAFRVLVATKRH